MLIADYSADHVRFATAQERKIHATAQRMQRERDRGDQEYEFVEHDWHNGACKACGSRAPTATSCVGSEIL